MFFRGRTKNILFEKVRHPVLQQVFARFPWIKPSKSSTLRDFKEDWGRFKRVLIDTLVEQFPAQSQDEWINQMFQAPRQGENVVGMLHALVEDLKGDEEQDYSVLFRHVLDFFMERRGAKVKTIHEWMRTKTGTGWRTNDPVDIANGYLRWAERHPLPSRLVCYEGVKRPSNGETNGSERGKKPKGGGDRQGAHTKQWKPKACFRCGYTGHLVGGCFAKFAKDGTPLPPREDQQQQVDKGGEATEVHNHAMVKKLPRDKKQRRLARKQAHSGSSVTAAAKGNDTGYHLHHHHHQGIVCNTMKLSRQLVNWLTWMYVPIPNVGSVTLMMSM
eukprot:m.223843 g.223843  ORF g.223843 m.223843 type:complete len:330 (-) comp15142_c0_seq2:857-1846(-)